MKKTDTFAESTEKLASLSKAIGHPARIQILLFLMDVGPSTCQDIVDKLPYSQSTVSGHLQKLKEDDELLFDQLIDITANDNLQSDAISTNDRFTLVYTFLSLIKNLFWQLEILILFYQKSYKL